MNTTKEMYVIKKAINQIRFTNLNFSKFWIRLKGTVTQKPIAVTINHL